MQRDPEDSEPTTEPRAADVEADGLGEEQVPRADDDVQAHIWAGTPPVVDDLQDAS